MAKRKWFWVSRDYSGKYVHIWLRKPTLSEREDWFSHGNDMLVGICVKYFKLATGLSIPSAKCVRVEFSGKVIVDA